MSREHHIRPITIVSMTLLLLLTQAWDADGAGWRRTSKVPRKVINVKGALGVEVLYAGLNPKIEEQSPRILGQIGLQTAWSPWMVDVSYDTTMGVELAVGWFKPLFPLGYGDVALSLFPFFRAAAEDVGSKSGNRNIDVFETFGAGVSLEYLMYTGHLTFFVEVRQTVLEPVSTWVAAGVSVSPLLWMLFRDD